VPNVRMTIVYLLEDDAVTRRNLEERLLAVPGLDVPVSVGTCTEMLSAVKAGRPDVLLCDLQLPDGNGVDVIRVTRELHPQVEVMVISVFGDEQRVVMALKAGATGYLLKDDPSSELGAAISQLLQGGSPISPAIARYLIRVFRPSGPEPVSGAPPRPLDPGIDLTTRELEVLQLAAKGFSYGEIARMLGISGATVSSYTKKIYGKLAVHSRSEAVYEASRLGLIDEARRNT
jgi:DNA-binding NarL/FixJ family response regulator